jgi:DNA-binding response OmpR family regulator
VESHTVEVYIDALRRKLAHEYIENVRSIGYHPRQPPWSLRSGYDGG